MLLTDHFSLEEMTITQVRGVDNSCPADLLPHLEAVAQTLELVRKLLGFPILVSSGYRCEEVNQRVGGVPDSAHIQAWAADFICPRFGTPLQICYAISGAGGIKFDTLIEEGTWVHLSIDPRMRGRILTKDPNSPTGYRDGLRKAMV